MKRKIALLLIFTFLFSAVSIIAVSAGGHHGRNNVKTLDLNLCENYYTEDGYRVYRPNVQYDEDGNATFGNGCYYYDADSRKISAYGEVICYYDEDGNLCSGVCGYCYAADGNRTLCPSYDSKSANNNCCGNGKR